MPRSKGLVRGVRHLRYHARSVERTLAFYTHLGFTLDHEALPDSAQASMGGLKLFLTGPAESEARLRDAVRKGIVLDVDDLAEHIEAMKKIGFRFRNEMTDGPDGKEIRLVDPDGNTVDFCETMREGASVM